MRTFRFTALAALLLAPVASSAAPFPALSSSVTKVEDVDSAVRHPYEETSSVTNCTAAGICSIVFAAVVDPRVVVVRASCVFTVATGGSFSNATLGMQGSAAFNYLPATTGGSTDSSTAFGINSDTYLFYAKGQKPRVSVVSLNAAVTNLQCTLTGYGIS